MVPVRMADSGWLVEWGRVVELDWQGREGGTYLVEALDHSLPLTPPSSRETVSGSRVLLAHAPSSKRERWRSST